MIFNRLKIQYFKPLYPSVGLNRCLLCDLTEDVYGNVCHYCLSDIYQSPQNLQCINLLQSVKALRTMNIDALDALFCAYRYQWPFDLWLSQYKYHAHFAAAEALLRFWHLSLRDAGGLLKSIDYLVVVPCHWQRELSRGYNQVDIFVNEILSLYPHIKRFDGIDKIQNSPSQASLGAVKRRSAKEFAYRLHASDLELENKSLLLIDDVVTTGNTLNQLARFFKQYQVKQVFAFTFAWAEFYD